MIDKIKLLQQIKEEYRNPCTNNEPCEYPHTIGCCYDKAVSTIIKLIEDQLEEDWVPCSKRLPEEQENSITYDWITYPVTVNIAGTLDIRYYKFGNGHWWNNQMIMDKYVTAWMPLPPVWKGENFTEDERQLYRTVLANDSEEVGINIFDQI